MIGKQLQDKVQELFYFLRIDVKPDSSTEDVLSEIDAYINSPSYYIHNGIDAKDLMPGLDYWKGSAIAHILRAGKKSGESEKEALENAVICLLRRIQELEVK